MAEAPAWRVRGTKQGDWPIDVEKRKHHTVTCIRNVGGDANALCTELQDALGAGGAVSGEKTRAPQVSFGSVASSAFRRAGKMPVSYTHLTLPTILRV